jgi:protein phosphatase
MPEDRPLTRSDSLATEAAPAVPVDCHGVSLAGAKRKVNQDDFVLSPLGTIRSAPAWLFAVADGIGGGPAGDRASSLAIQTIREFVARTVAQPEVIAKIDPADLLVKGVQRCHEEILADVEAHPRLFGMGTTLTVALVIWPQAWVIHAGDSRCYLLRGSHLEPLTVDQTMVQRMTEKGILTTETARQSRWRHALWNHLGKTSGPVEPDVVSAQLRPGDALMLTTDGITDPLPDGALETIAGEPGSARNLSCRIVRAAAERGGRDDMTLIFVRFAPAVPEAAEPAMSRVG